MQFSAPAEHYDRFMGRYLPGLAVALADAAGVAPGMRALDVGCGPGGLTRELVARLGAGQGAGGGPAGQVAGGCRRRGAARPPRPPRRPPPPCRERNPGADVRVGAAEDLPFGDGAFDVALASL